MEFHFLEPCLFCLVKFFLINYLVIILMTTILL